MSGAAPSAWRPSLPEATSRRGSSINPNTRAASRNDCRSQPSNPHDGFSSTSRCNPGRAGVGTANRSTLGPAGSGLAPTGRVVSRAERIGTRARSAAWRLSSSLADLDAPVRSDARAARKTENRCRRSRRRPCCSGVDVDEDEWLAMVDSVARTVGDLLVVRIKRNAIGRSPGEPPCFIRPCQTGDRPALHEGSRCPVGRLHLRGVGCLLRRTELVRIHRVAAVPSPGSLELRTLVKMRLPPLGVEAPGRPSARSAQTGSL